MRISFEDERLAVVLETQGDLPPEIGEDLIRPVFVDPVNRQPFLRPARRTAVMMNVENRHHSLVETEINDILHPIKKGRLDEVLGIVDVEVPAPSDRQPNGVDSLRLVKTDETARNALVAPVEFVPAGNIKGVADVDAKVDGLHEVRCRTRERRRRTRASHSTKKDKHTENKSDSHHLF